MPALSIFLALSLPCILLLSQATLARGDRVSGSVRCISDKSGCVFSPGIDRSAQSWGWYEGTMNSSGWSTLTAVANPTMGISQTSYALGYLEGVLTAEMMWPFYLNVVYDTFNDWSPDTVSQVKSFMRVNTNWVLGQVQANPSVPLWQRVGSMYEQMQGMADGYNSVAPQQQRISFDDFTLLSGMGDLSDIASALNTSLRPSPNMTEEEMRYRERKYEHCSALVRFTSAMDELLAGHTTWTSYSQMLRVWKYYSYADATISLSGYPGCLSSTDDFFQTSNRLVVMETTLPVYNGSLYDLVAPVSLLSWVRAMVANRMARNGTHWVQLFSTHNSGTYNNAWMVVDYNLFVAGRPLREHTLTVAEQLPGTVISGDATQMLWTGSYPSFNRAFFPATSALSGQAQMAARHGAMYTYQGSVRAKIFRRDSASADTIQGLQTLLRYNHYQTDPFSKRDPSESIAARFDLGTPPEASGAIDAKCTSSALVREMKSLAISGPTWDSQPVFEWSPIFPDAHYGQPSRFQFPWIQMEAAA